MLKNELHRYAHELIQKLAQRPPFKQQAVLNLREQFLKGNPAVTYSRIWPLVVLEEWINS